MPPAAPREGKFWRINAGHVCSMCLTVLAVLGFFLTYDRQIQTTAKDLANHMGQHELEMKSRAAEQIKDSQTRATADLIVHERLKSMEDARQQIAPQLSRMDEKLNWITDWIKEQKTASQADRTPKH